MDSEATAALHPSVTLTLHAFLILCSRRSPPLIACTPRLPVTAASNLVAHCAKMTAPRRSSLVGIGHRYHQQVWRGCRRSPHRLRGSIRCLISWQHRYPHRLSLVGSHRHSRRRHLGRSRARLCRHSSARQAQAQSRPTPRLSQPGLLGGPQG